MSTTRLETPLVSALGAYLDDGVIGFTTPGH